ncbi:MAG TPA: FtsX-like permease family protein [Candidatus Paceibacterota bacterium]|nr:FtsX-like permease family protein [Candidatus Paceibacterota bacterium]
MPKKKNIFNRLMVDMRVGRFLAIRDLRRSNIWTTGLIVFVMMLTFLNLVVVGGILVGLIQGAIDAHVKYGTGDIQISPLSDRSTIQHTPEIIEIARNLPGYRNHVVRYFGGAQVESDYRATIDPRSTRDKVSATLMGINPNDEKVFSDIDHRMIEGKFLEPNDLDSVLVGKNLLAKYTPIDDPSFKNLKNVELGSKILVSSNGVSKEYIVKGVMRSKVDFDMAITMVDSEVRRIQNQTDFNASRISIHLKPGTNARLAVQQMLDTGVGAWARVQVSMDAIPKTVKDMKDTFDVLGTLLSVIGLAVSSITIFIVIFVNAITRRRYIGILKGIGITERAIEISYVAQAMFYAIIGSGLGIAAVFLFIKPFIATHPIDFPFSDGILVADAAGAALRAGVLIISTLIAGFIPARIIIKQNTLSAILGR